MPSFDEQFMEIIQDAISKGCEIGCEIAEYIDQMKGWQEAIQICIDASENDLERLEEEQANDEGPH